MARSARSDPMLPTRTVTPDFSVIIVNFNAAAWLRVCLRSLQELGGEARLEVILVDNGSRDDSLAVARSIMPDLIAMPQSTNLGYVRANNVGLRRATGRYVLFLNNDTEFRHGCLAELLRFLDAHPQAGAASPQILNPDGSDQGCARRFPSPLNGIFGRRSILTRWFPKNRWSRSYLLCRQRTDDEPFEVEILSTACMAMPTGLAKDLGGMDEGFRHYWVDADICSQIRKRGFSVNCVPRAKITHFEGQGGSTSTWRQRCRAILNFHRDAYRAYHKNYDLGAAHPMRWFVAAALTIRAACLMLIQIVRPGQATTSGGKN